MEAGPPQHDCLGVLDKVYSSRPNLTDKPLPNPDLILYTGSSGFIHEGKSYAGYAVASDNEVIEAKALLQGQLAQRAELWALIKSIRTKQEKANQYIYTHVMHLPPCTYMEPYTRRRDF